VYKNEFISLFYSITIKFKSTKERKNIRTCTCVHARTTTMSLSIHIIFTHLILIYHIIIIISNRIVLYCTHTIIMLTFISYFFLKRWELSLIVQLRPRLYCSLLLLRPKLHMFALINIFCPFLHPFSVFYLR